MAVYSIGRRRVIALLVLTSILLITFDTRGSAILDRGRSIFALALEPFDAASRTISRPIVNAWNGITNYDDLRRENQVLQAQLDAQQGAVIEARAAILEYQELLTLNRLLGTSDYPTVTAQVQGTRPGNFQYTVEINRGSKDGIAVGMPVVNGRGLVGKINTVFPNSAIVLLIIDPGFNIGAKVLTAADGTIEVPTSTPLRPTEQGAPTATSTTTTTTTIADALAPPVGPLDPINPATTSTTVAPSTTIDPTAPVTSAGATIDPTLSTVSTATTVPSVTTTTVPQEIIRETGTLTGQGPDQPLILRFIEDSSSYGRVKVGSPVQTAGGLRSIAPPGLPIGTVSAVTPQTGTRTLRVEVTLGAGSLDKLNFVQVLRFTPATSGS